LVARRDGLPIVWPKPTHGPKLERYKTAASIIDWSIHCPSIFDRKKPLAEKTLTRIAEGLRRFIFECEKPFIVNSTVPLLTEHANGSSQRNFDIEEPLRTQCANVKGGHFALVSAFLAKHYTGVIGHGLERPIGTVTTADHHSLVTAHIQRDFSSPVFSSASAPVGAITAQGGGKLAVIQAFLIKYYGTGGQCQSLHEPVHTVPTKARLGLVTVKGVDYQVIDIGMRMLQPSELYADQGFPINYIFNIRLDGSSITKTQQIAKCGNSVPPPVVQALVNENYSEESQESVGTER